MSNRWRLFMGGAQVAVLAVTLVACAARPANSPTAPTGTPAGVTPAPSAQTLAPGATPTAPATSPSEPSRSAPTSPEPVESAGTTTGGDIPDNAIFLPYQDATHGFSIMYVEGWQVTPSSDGVLIRDKDSSETVQVVAPVTDVAAYISSTDLPGLQALPGFQLVTQDVVKVNGVDLNHIQYHAPSPPDPVTGKEVPSTIDRYYVPGTTGLAIVTLSTPDGVDNVDAFREMIKSFTWS